MALSSMVPRTSPVPPEPVVAAGAEEDPGAAGDLIYRALKGSGKFSAVVSGVANAQPVRFTVDLTIEAHVKYSLM